MFLNESSFEPELLTDAVKSVKNCYDIILFPILSLTIRSGIQFSIDSFLHQHYIIKLLLFFTVECRIRVDRSENPFDWKNRKSKRLLKMKRIHR